MRRDIISELNRENRQRMLLTPALVLTVWPTVCVILLLLYIFSPEIDAFASRHPLLTGWGLVIIGLGGIVWREVRR